MRKWILVLSATAALLLGLERVGVTPLFPGKDLGVEIQGLADPARVEITTDAGDVEVLLVVAVRAIGEEDPEWQAQLGGRNLLVEERRVGARQWRLEIYERGDGKDREKFRWPSGTRLRVTAARGVEALEVYDWIAYLKSDRHDSQERAQNRRVWFWISLGLWGLTILGAVYGVLGQIPAAKADDVLTKQRLVVLIIETVTGESEEETGKMRQLLRMILLEGATPKEALDAIGPFERERDRLSLYPRARKRALNHLEFFLDEMSEARKRLQQLGHVE